MIDRNTNKPNVERILAAVPGIRAKLTDDDIKRLAQAIADEDGPHRAGYVAGPMGYTR